MCTPVHAHIGVHVHICACKHHKTTTGVPQHHPWFLEVGYLIGLEIAHQVLVICLSLPPQGWDYKHVRSSLVDMDFGDQL